MWRFKYANKNSPSKKNDFIQLLKFMMYGYIRGIREDV